MLYIELTNEGKKGYAKLNQPILGRINDAIEELKKDSPGGDIVPLKGHPGSYRLRVGDYRILYYEENETRYIFKIAPRGAAYRRLP